MSSPRSKPIAYRSYSTKTQSTKVLSAEYSGSESESFDDTNNGRRSAIRQEPQGQETHKDFAISSPSAYDTLIIHNDDGPRFSSGIPKYRYGNRDEINNQGQKNGGRQNVDMGVREITNIPDDYLSQSHVLKHLAKEVKVDPSKRDSNLSRWHDTDKNAWLPEYRPTPIRNLVKSKSQPNLGTGLLKIERAETDPMRHTLGNARKDQKMLSIVDCLMMENKSLKIELESCHQKVAKSYRLEQEVSKVYRSHQELVESSERRERLERTARLKLQAEVRRLQDANRSLRDQSLSSSNIDSNQMVKRETMIAQLITQNKELLAAKERQEIELAAQRATLEEQRTHIDILDTALTNAQSNVVRLEEECRKKQVHVERVAQLQRALSSLQLASDRREQTERKLRLQLERELMNERARNNNASQDCSTDNEPGESLPELKRMLREKDEKIMRLEGEVAKWEQRYLEESELRQAAIDAASIPKDAKIAALEKTGQESEKLIAEARSDKLKQMEEVHAAHKKVSELESRMKELESRLAERDAMIRVLQKKHSFEKDVSGSYPSICLGHHTPHSSLNTTDLTSDDLGFGSNNSYTSSVDSAYHHHHANKYSSANQSFDHKSLDDQLKELDSQLLNKRGLCCFPGFSHTGSLSRKAKTPQPLLEGVTGNFLGHRADDIMLLEKQGLCSQAQRQTQESRCGSLPPSSLPRPKRHRKSSSKVGEYGRLSDSDVKSKDPKKLGEYSHFNDSRKNSLNSLDTSSDMSTAPNTPTECTTSVKFEPLDRSHRQSPLPPDGRYHRLRRESDDVTSRESSCTGPRESPSRNSINRESRSSITRESPPRVMMVGPRDSPGKSILDPPRVMARESPGRSFYKETQRSFIPPPRKIDFASLGAPDSNKLTNIESKLRIFSPGGIQGRRGSLQRDGIYKGDSNNKNGVRSLPTPNKYRIQF